MASSKQVMLLAAVAAVASLASATQWIVGDGDGWRGQFNQTGWADGKTFVVGDTLLFKYTQGTHTVVQVGKDDFAACNLQGNQLGSWYSGNDVVPLGKPGKAWFICTKPNHCLNGMKLAVDVVAAPFPFPGTAAPAPSPLPRWPFPWWRSAAPAPSLAPASPPSAAVRNPIGATVAVAAAAVVAAALAF